MPFLIGLEVLIQFTFAFHALRTGRPIWWLYVIMGMPVIGCLLYYFVEVFPGSREHRSAHKAARKLVKALQPDADLKRRAEELEVCGSTDNKIALARECMDHQMYQEAASLYESCLQGAFAQDSSVLFLLAQAAVEGAMWDKASSVLARLKASTTDFRVLEIRLLEARVHEGRSETDAALAAYRELVPRFVGMEARYQYGELLQRLGQHEAANHVFNEILAQSRRAGPVMDDEQQWISAARRVVAVSG
jgi:hypothetical protein